MVKITQFSLQIHIIKIIIVCITIFIFGMACENFPQNNYTEAKMQTFAAQQPPCDGRGDIPFGPEQCIYLTTEEACSQHQDQCQYIQSYRVWMEQEECMYEDWEGCIPRPDADAEEGSFIYFRALVNSKNTNDGSSEFVTFPYKTNYAHQFHPCLIAFENHPCSCTPTPP